MRDLALSDRKRDLDRLCRKSKVPYLRQVETFPDGAVRFDYCSKFGFEGVVSNRKGSRYSSGPKPQLGQDDVPGWNASTRSGVACLRVRANPS